MKKLILLFVLCFVTPLYAQVLPPVGSGQLSGGGSSGSPVAGGQNTSGYLTGDGSVGTPITLGACVDGGTIASAGTVTPDYLASNCYTFTTASSSVAVTVANATHVPAKGTVVYLGEMQASTGFPQATWGTNYMIWAASANGVVTMNGLGGMAGQMLSNSATGIGWLAFMSDGTRLTVQNGTGSQMNVSQLTAQGNVKGGSMTSTGIITPQQVATVATLPATCTKGGFVVVLDVTTINPAAGTCTGGGSNAVIAVCSATNTWSCL